MAAQVFEILKQQEDVRRAENLTKKVEFQKELAAIELVRYFSAYLFFLCSYFLSHGELMI